MAKALHSTLFKALALFILSCIFAFKNKVEACFKISITGAIWVGPDFQAWLHVASVCLCDSAVKLSSRKRQSFNWE
jgi:hypothetical protein